jgi:hypothetical protein
MNELNWNGAGRWDGVRQWRAIVASIALPLQVSRFQRINVQTHSRNRGASEHALEIVAGAQRRLADEVDGAQERGEVAKFGKQDFVYVAADDVYLCRAGEQLPYRFTNEEDGKTLRRYWTTACQACALKSKCTTDPPPN